MSSEIVKEVFVDENGMELDIGTPYVKRMINVPTMMRVPLYVQGVRKSAAELAALGLTVKGYTQDELDTVYYADLYTKNPQLAVRVRQYKAILNKYALAATATSDVISQMVTDEADKAALLTLMHDIELNYNEVCPGMGLNAYNELPKLIQYLPAEVAEEPAPEV